MNRTDRIAAGFASAARWHLLGRLLTRPRPGWHEQLVELAREVDDPDLAAAVEAAAGAQEGAYLAALGPGSSISPREVAHVGLRDPGWILADLARYYDVFGYAPRAEDPLDHVAVETDFFAYLHLKEAVAWANDDADAAATTHAARDDFARFHLGPLAAALAHRLAATSTVSHLVRATTALAAAFPTTAVPDAPPTDALAEDCAGCGYPR